MPGPYRRLDVPNVNSHVVTAKPEPVKPKSKRAASPAPAPKVVDVEAGEPADKEG